MNRRVDLVRNSLPSSNELVLETIEETEDGIVFRTLIKRLPCCPACLQSRVSYHSHYVRRMRDLPWQGRRVEIHLKTRRFRCPKAHGFRLLSLRFKAMLRWRCAKKLKNWIDSTTASGFPFVAQFASTLRRDLEAVELLITTPWSNGPIEGHINRLKAIKRQMYGRAGFEPSKARVLPWDISKAA